MKYPVKVHNDLNKIPLRSFKEKEIDIFYTLLFKAKEQESDLINISFAELKELTQYKSTSLERFYKDIDSTYMKILGLNLRIIKEDSFGRLNLFQKYLIHPNEKRVEIRVDKEFKYLINDLIGTYTKFDLIELTKLKSSYSKMLFRHLKQFNSTGEYRVKLEDFRDLFSIPESYRMTDLNVQIFNPVLKELSPIFQNLKLEKQKNDRTNKRTITHLLFTFDAIDSPKVIYSTNTEKRIKKTSIFSNEEIEESKERYEKTKIFNLSGVFEENRTQLTLEIMRFEKSTSRAETELKLKEIYRINKDKIQGRIKSIYAILKLI